MESSAEWINDKYVIILKYDRAEIMILPTELIKAVQMVSVSNYLIKQQKELSGKEELGK